MTADAFVKNVDSTTNAHSYVTMQNESSYRPLLPSLSMRLKLLCGKEVYITPLLIVIPSYFLQSSVSIRVPAH